MMARKINTDLAFPDKELFDYDPTTGIITKSGRPVGKAYDNGTAPGYVRFKHAGRLWDAHRVAWLLHYGAWPEGFIDHVNRVRSDNRIENLRAATHSQNMANVGRMRSNTSGFKGVTERAYKSGIVRWSADIRRDGRTVFLGNFDTADEAAEAYNRAAALTQGEFALMNDVEVKKPMRHVRGFQGNQWTTKQATDPRRPMDLARSLSMAGERSKALSPEALANRARILERRKLLQAKARDPVGN